MAKMVMRLRHVGGYRYVRCENCRHEMQTEKPIQLHMPYCGECGMIVLDLMQKYCCWCGSEFTGDVLKLDCKE